MKIPKRIEKLIERRARLAWDLTSVDHELSVWLEKKYITEQLDVCDYLGGCEMYVNPDDSAMRIREAILNH